MADIYDQKADLGIERIYNLPLSDHSLKQDPKLKQIVHHKISLSQVPTPGSNDQINAWKALRDPDFVERPDGLGKGNLHHQGVNFHPEQKNQVLAKKSNIAENQGSLKNLAAHPSVELKSQHTGVRLSVDKWNSAIQLNSAPKVATVSPMLQTQTCLQSQISRPKSSLPTTSTESKPSNKQLTISNPINKASSVSSSRHAASSSGGGGTRAPNAWGSKPLAANAFWEAARTCIDSATKWDVLRATDIKNDRDTSITAEKSAESQTPTDTKATVFKPPPTSKIEQTPYKSAESQTPTDTKATVFKPPPTSEIEQTPYSAPQFLRCMREKCSSSSLAPKVGFTGFETFLGVQSSESIKHFPELYYKAIIEQLGPTELDYSDDTSNENCSKVKDHPHTTPLPPLDSSIPKILQSQNLESSVDSSILQSANIAPPFSISNLFHSIFNKSTTNTADSQILNQKDEASGSRLIQQMENDTCNVELPAISAASGDTLFPPISKLPQISSKPTNNTPNKSPVDSKLSCNKTSNHKSVESKSTINETKHGTMNSNSSTPSPVQRNSPLLTTAPTQSRNPTARKKRPLNIYINSGDENIAQLSIYEHENSAEVIRAALHGKVPDSEISRISTEVAAALRKNAGQP
ncbi:hypothetical protein NEOLI_004955 [Neolecta irregularis DAH-3]|uniref:Uncharacterized protein n=1 Tax=Neolecta irregularis (strain DAH-3) TaxID=1198029 RepID=A0A1U7LKR7_NEOID|nr:hypothetical protein NEOLI_004955 [Neolecta irregularis DAH-3]|eukprot:OLL23244.1 hypothetical protein NEOLI_004955 [Neolecta irregularis DAH-3]